MPKVNFDAEPAPLSVDLDRAALVIIDMQRDFLEPGGFGEALGNDVSRLQAAVEPCRQVLDAARRVGMLVIHTREGHRPDLSDAPPHKVERGDPANRIGAPGPMGRILVRGEPGHDIIPELYPLPAEPVIDKPGKGAFYQTDLELMLRNRDIDTLFVCGVTTEVCVNTTVREANDRGFRCIVLSDCCGSYFPAISRRRLGHDQGPRRYFRLGNRLATAAQFAGSNELIVFQRTQWAGSRRFGVEAMLFFWQVNDRYLVAGAVSMIPKVDPVFGKIMRMTNCLIGMTLKIKVIRAIGRYRIIALQSAYAAGGC